MEYYIDGSGWNGANAAYCVCQNKKKKFLKVIYEEKQGLEMEYIALLVALADANKGDTIYTDSQNMVNQIRSKPDLQDDQIRDLRDDAGILVDVKSINLVWIPRAQNIAGHILEDRLKKLKRYRVATTSLKKKGTPIKTVKIDFVREFSEEKLEEKESGTRKIIRIIPHMDIVRHCRKLVTNSNYGQRGEFDGDFYQQLFGMVAQTIVCDLLGLDWPKESKGFDGGYDIVWEKIKWDVKCEIRSGAFKRGYVHNVNGSQMNYEATGFIFVSLNQMKNEYEVCGFISKKRFLEKARYFKQGKSRVRSDDSLMMVRNKGGMYEIDQENLTKFKE